MLQSDKTYIFQVISQLEDGTSQLNSILANNHLPSQAKEVIECMIKTRIFAANYLQRLLEQPEGLNRSEHAFGSVLHKLYPDMINRLPESVSQPVLEALSHVEEETRNSMRNALNNVSSDSLKTVLIDLNPRLNRVGNAPIPVHRAS